MAASALEGIRSGGLATNRLAISPELSFSTLCGMFGRVADRVRTRDLRVPKPGPNNHSAEEYYEWGSVGPLVEPTKQEFLGTTASPVATTAAP